MASQYNITIRDRSDEYSGFSIPVTDIDETNWVTELAQHAAIRAAVAGLTIGNIAREQLVAYNNAVDDTRPTNPYAQRELGLRLFYQDTTTQKKGYITIPCPDLSVVETPGSDEVDLAGVTAVNTLVGLLETSMKSPAGNPVEFYRGVIVGRRN